MHKNILILCLLFIVIAGVHVVNAEQYNQIYRQLAYPELSPNESYSVNLDTLSHHDLQILLQSGTITFFEPVVHENDTLFFGGYFEGYGTFRFSPSAQMEKDQLNRFFATDSLNREFEKILLFFTPTVYKQLTNKNSKSEIQGDLKDLQDEADKLYREVRRDGAYLYSFELLRNLIYPFGKEYFLASVKPANTDELIYLYNPYLREEVQFRKRFWEPGQNFIETINSYSQYNVDETYININGRDKKQLDTKTYSIDAQIDNNGNLTCKTEVTFEVISGPTQFIEVNLLPSLALDSIIDNKKNNVRFIREKLDVSFKNWETSQVGLLLDKPYMFGDTLQLTFYYNGEIAQKGMGELFIFAGAKWYPRYGFRDRAIFNMTFKTDKDYTFTSCGNKLSERKEGEYLVTKWNVIPEASNVSFSLGYMKKYLFEEDGLPPIEIFFSKELHNEIATYLAQDLIAIGKDMEKQIHEDISNATKTFNHYFGEYTNPKISVSEILMPHSEAFPGFIHLGFSTWINTDHWGNDRLLRAHETAHQWWGVGVGYQTYHDQWLSEGFAEYSALMYLQVVLGNEMFLDKLRDSRNNIYSARKFLFGSGAESGPIALGYRTSSTETAGDYGLIIYKKGAYVLHMLRNMLIDLKTMNEDVFLSMMREFYGSFRGKEATTQDFRRIAEKYAGIDLGWFFDQWVYHNYLPECDFKYDIEQDPTSGLYTAKCKVVTKKVPEGFKMYIPLELQIDNTSKAYIRLLIETNDFYFELPNLPQKPKRLVLNPFESVLAKINQ